MRGGRQATRCKSLRPADRVAHAMTRTFLDRRDGTAVDDVLGAGDRGGPRRGEKSDQVGHFLRPGRASETGCRRVSSSEPGAKNMLGKRPWFNVSRGHRYSSPCWRILLLGSRSQLCHHGTYDEGDSSQVGSRDAGSISQRLPIRIEPLVPGARVQLLRMLRSKWLDGFTLPEESWKVAA